MLSREVCKLGKLNNLIIGLQTTQKLKTLKVSCQKVSVDFFPKIEKCLKNLVFTMLEIFGANEWQVL